MIDFEKLQQAKELIKELNKDGLFFRQYTQTYFDNSETVEEISYRLGNPNEYDQDFKSIDDLIAKLQELTQQKPKYKGGQDVFVSSAGKLEKLKISRYIKEYNLYECYGKICSYNENELFISKQFLIESQINYWINLFNEELVNSQSQEKCPCCRLAYCQCASLQKGCIKGEL